MNRRGFTIIELLITIAVIAVLATLGVATYVPVRRNANDKIRFSTINEMGRLVLASDCYRPDAGTGDYDIKTIYDEMVAANPEVKKYVSAPPRDPKTGTADQTNYRYVYSDADGGHCAIYANLENPQAEVALTAISAPTPGGGTGYFESTTVGPNGTNRYYQISR
jgi:prepilin-type N-terminal cleavage/methylation domain-containing protein